MDPDDYWTDGPEEERCDLCGSLLAVCRCPDEDYGR